jgi:carbamoyltransferase
MGLAPYGEPRYVDLILRHLVDLRDDGSFTLDQRYFDYLGGLTMTSPAFDALFGGPPRPPESPLRQRDLDLARSVQQVCEEIVLRMARTAHRETGLPDLCMAGGVALNCVANARVLREGPFRRLWVQPAAGDAGGAVGAALLAWHRALGGGRAVGRGGDGRPRDAMRGALLGPAFGDDEVEAVLRAAGAAYERVDRWALPARVAELLAAGRVVGWFQGRMEFGPRALGARSILGDPRDPTMQRRMNVAIKFREGSARSRRACSPSARPSGSSSTRVALHAAHRAGARRAPPARRRRRAPRARPARRAALRDPGGDARRPLGARADGGRRGAAALPRAARGVRGAHRVPGARQHVVQRARRAVVCTPADAYRCFMRTGLDHLVLGPFLLDRAAQPAPPAAPGAAEFPPD